MMNELTVNRRDPITGRVEKKSLLNRKYLTKHELDEIFVGDEHYD